MAGFPISRWSRPCEFTGAKKRAVPSNCQLAGFAVTVPLMAVWFWYAVLAALLYGAHQIFTRLAAERIGEGLGGFVVEASAALSILIDLWFLLLCGRWRQKINVSSIFQLLRNV